MPIEVQQQGGGDQLVKIAIRSNSSKAPQISNFIFVMISLLKSAAVTAGRG